MRKKERKNGKRHVASVSWIWACGGSSPAHIAAKNSKWLEREKVILPLCNRHDVIGSTIYASFECDGASISCSSIRSILMLMSFNFLFDQSCDLPRGMPTKHNRWYSNKILFIIKERTIWTFNKWGGKILCMAQLNGMKGKVFFFIPSNLLCWIIWVFKSIQTVSVESFFFLLWFD